jgi:RNA polymerase sigma-70 factor, ECF subfamily
VVLCDIEGFSYEEIAATLGVKLGTVRSRIHRGRAQLRTALGHRRPATTGEAATAEAATAEATNGEATRGQGLRRPGLVPRLKRSGGS